MWFTEICNFFYNRSFSCDWCTTQFIFWGNAWKVIDKVCLILFGHTIHHQHVWSRKRRRKSYFLSGPGRVGVLPYMGYKGMSGPKGGGGEGRSKLNLCLNRPQFAIRKRQIPSVWLSLVLKILPICFTCIENTSPYCNKQIERKCPFFPRVCDLPVWKLTKLY